MAQALVRYLAAQKIENDGKIQPLFAGIWAIFGHGNVAGLGEALYQDRDTLPTLRAHNEQSMAHAAIAYAKTKNRRQIMACTTSIGPGATNMVTAAALAHVNRLPVLFLPGDVFADRRPDPVLQQIENPADPTITANDCFRPVSRYWDRITRPEQLLTSLPRALAVLTDPIDCGPVTLSLCQDVQTEAGEFPESFFVERIHRPRCQSPDSVEIKNALALLSEAQKPLIIAGGGVHYSAAADILANFAQHRSVPVAETQAGKGALPWNHAFNVGSIGVTGSSAANTLAAEADVILAIGTRLQDFTTASRSLFKGQIIQLNVAISDAGKHGAMPLVGDARLGLEALDKGLGKWSASPDWVVKTKNEIRIWNKTVDEALTPSNAKRPSDAEVIGAISRQAKPTDTIVCAAGGLPGELHKLWRTAQPGGYHVEYGYSCMGYEIAGGLGVRMAKTGGEVIVMVGDGSYLMLNSEIATSVMMEKKLIIVVLDNHGFGCINRLQQSIGGDSFNNLLSGPAIDFAAHAASLGAQSEKVKDIAALEAALTRARTSPKTYVIVIDTDPALSTKEGGAWWNVAVPEISPQKTVQKARSRYEEAIKGVKS
ncbi:MAG: 3D-(3,5/4)-trihydroxycyclohexane-1,2-dione acylhydrolase (decyclizing) [Proteobacteria bacterium]|nr:3D-(3,5/4)-trihydroxycyclohexane-1,2-dione acylhydrolase (decyclizing) [Pseudomonadota bacterium]